MIMPRATSGSIACHLMASVTPRRANLSKSSRRFGIPGRTAHSSMIGTPVSAFCPRNSMGWSKYFTVQGALNIERSPQGRPVIIQAGASDTGRDFAAETAEVVFGSGASLDEAKAFYRDLKGRMGKFGRQPDELKIATGISVVIGESEQEARDKLQSWQELIHPDVGVLRLGQDLETDLSDLPLDGPIPEHRIPQSS